MTRAGGAGAGNGAAPQLVAPAHRAVEQQDRRGGRQEPSLGPHAQSRARDPLPRRSPPLLPSRRSPVPSSVTAAASPSPTLSPTHPVPRGLLTLCPAARSGPQGLYTAYIQPICSQYLADMQPICSLHTALRSPLDCLLPRARGACSARPLLIHLECNVFCKTSILYNAMRAASHTCPESEPKEPRLPGPLRTRGRVLTRRGTRRE